MKSLVMKSHALQLPYQLTALVFRGCLCAFLHQAIGDVNLGSTTAEAEITVLLGCIWALQKSTLNQAFHKAWE